MKLALDRILLQNRKRVGERRRTILQIIYRTPESLSAQQIYQRSLELDKRVSFATVTKTLNLLLAAGLIRRSGVLHRKVLFQRRDT